MTTRREPCQPPFQSSAREKGATATIARLCVQHADSSWKWDNPKRNDCCWFLCYSLEDDNVFGNGNIDCHWMYNDKRFSKELAKVRSLKLSLFLLLLIRFWLLFFHDSYRCRGLPCLTQPKWVSKSVRSRLLSFKKKSRFLLPLAGLSPIPESGPRKESMDREMLKKWERLIAKLGGNLVSTFVQNGLIALAG